MLPIMTEALSGLVNQSQFAILKDTQQDGDTVEAAESVGYLLGCLQPLNPRKLLVKPEGWRRWKWFTLWTTKELEVGFYIRDDKGLQYRVMSKSDWSQAAYLEYVVTQGASMGAEAP